MMRYRKGDDPACGAFAGQRRGAFLGHLHSAGNVSLLCVMLTALLSGCGANKEAVAELSAYTEEMTGFYQTLAQYQNELDLVDGAQEDAEQQALKLVDQMAVLCEDAAGNDVPEGYETAGELCRQAAEYLQEASEAYHAAFDGEALDQENLEKANQSCEAAGQCLLQMAECLEAAGG